MPELWEIAVPIPIHEPLTYEVPAALASDITRGMRVEVPVANRTLTGVALRPAESAPEEVRIRPVTRLLDLEPVLTDELLELAEFTADYYMAPIGEVVRTMLPPDLDPWGRQRLRITDRGAFAVPRDEIEEDLLATLREAGSMRLADLRRRLADHDLSAIAATVDRLQEERKVSLRHRRRKSGNRYVTAVELGAGELEDLLERCGRSRPGREVVRRLHELGRPATRREVCEAVGCGEGVVRRLVDLGVLRSFTQIERLDLEREILSRPPDRPPTLRPDQQTAVDALVGAIHEDGYSAFLLSGMTGSGKTEVYLRAAESALERGRGVLLLVPEIALVPALARSARQRFGRRLALLHSGMGGAEREQEWQRVRAGSARVVLGPRSAVFAPIHELGLVVVDEEQDGAYKQDTVPRYNGRDLALLRASLADAVTCLVSATPSMESRQNASIGKLEPLRLTQRVGEARLPEGILVDLRREPIARGPGEVVFSETLRAEIGRALEAGEQIVLLRNRRGYAPTLLCRACGEDHRCDACGLPKTLHRRTGSLLCHYCSARRPVPTVCESCGEEALEPIGTGTERVEERFASLFPDAEVVVLDRDTVQRRGGAAAVLERFGSGDAQVLIGTQMVSKGHHFPDVALAAVLAADSYLGFPDFRAVERTYTLLTQLAGRAGRGDRPGRVVVQTFHPDHYAITAALEHDDSRFAEEELRFRRVFHYPPFTRLTHLLVRDTDRDRAEEGIASLATALEAHRWRHRIRLTGPAPAPLERLRDRWRFQLLLRSESACTMRQMVREVAPENPPYDLVVDVDPYDLM